MDTYVLMTDSTCDLTAEMAKELDVEVIPFNFIMDGNTYAGELDYREMPIEEFYSKLRNGSMSTTSQINSEEFTSRFEPYLKEGKDVLYIAFSSGLSGTCQSAMIAKRDLEEKYPGRKIEIFDSLCASMGQGLFVYHAAKKRQAGSGISELMGWMKDNVMGLAHWFTVDDLNFLKRGGRVSTATAVLGTMLGIKPVLHVDDEGHLVPVSKVRGRKQSLDALVKKMEETVVDPKDQVVFVSHGDSLEDAQYVAKEVKRKFKPKEIHINYIGPIVGGHSGPGTIALFFLATGRGDSSAKEG